MSRSPEGVPTRLATVAQIRRSALAAETPADNNPDSAAALELQPDAQAHIGGNELTIYHHKIDEPGDATGFANAIEERLQPGDEVQITIKRRPTHLRVVPSRRSKILSPEKNARRQNIIARSEAVFRSAGPIPAEARRRRLGRTAIVPISRRSIY